MFKHAQLESVKAWLGDPAHAALPLHARVQRAIRQLILEGVISVGRPLPASRALAMSLAVSRDTVESAYSQLHAEGFIERRVGSGSFVSERVQRLPGLGKLRSKHVESTETPCLSLRGQVMFKSGGVRDFLAPRPFAPGVPETRNFPLPIWERLERQVLKEYGTQALTAGYGAASPCHCRLRQSRAGGMCHRRARAGADQLSAGLGPLRERAA